MKAWCRAAAGDSLRTWAPGLHFEQSSILLRMLRALPTIQARCRVWPDDSLHEVSGCRRHVQVPSLPQLKKISPAGKWRDLAFVEVLMSPKAAKRITCKKPTKHRTHTGVAGVPSKPGLSFSALRVLESQGFVEGAVAFSWLLLHIRKPKMPNL